MFKHSWKATEAEVKYISTHLNKTYRTAYLQFVTSPIYQLSNLLPFEQNTTRNAINSVVLLPYSAVHKVIQDSLESW